MSMVNAKNASIDKLKKTIDKTFLHMKIVCLNTLILTSHISNVNTPEQANQEAKALEQIAREYEKMCNELGKEFEEILEKIKEIEENTNESK